MTDPGAMLRELVAALDALDDAEAARNQSLLSDLPDVEERELACWKTRRRVARARRAAEAVCGAGTAG